MVILGVGCTITRQHGGLILHGAIHGINQLDGHALAGIVPAFEHAVMLQRICADVQPLTNGLCQCLWRMVERKP